MIEVSKEKYHSGAVQMLRLKLISTFSDPDGTLPFGYGCPAFDTDWGIDSKVMARCEMRKSDASQEKWDYRFFLDESLLK